MDWFSVSNLINVLAVVVCWSIRNELKHIGKSIEAAKDCAVEAKNIAARAHARIDNILEARKLFP